MYRDSNLQKTIGQWTASSFIGGASLLFVLFLMQASSISRVDGSAEKIVGIGPIQILEISKQVVGEGTSASFELLWGAIAYIVLLVLIAGAGAWWSSRTE